MIKKVGLSFLVAILGLCLGACEDAEFSKEISSLAKLDNGAMSDEEIIDIEATDKQIQEVGEAIDEDLKDSLEEVMKDDPSNERVKLYLCKQEQEVPKDVIIEEDGCGYLRDVRGGYVRSTNGNKVRVGSCSEHEVEVTSEPKPKVPKYMVCHAVRGMQDNGVTVCLPKAEIESYVKTARQNGGTSYLGPCR